MMEFAWNPLGAVGLVVGILSCVLAGIVWGARAGHEPNRFLATYLFASGLYMAVSNGLRLFAVDARDAYALIVAGSAANALAIGAFVLFVASLDSPIVGWMRRFGLRWFVAGLFGALAIHVVVRPEAHMPGVQALEGFSGWGIVSSPLRGLVLLGFIAVFIFAAAPAIHAWRRAQTAKTRLLRRQAAILAAAFATSSLGWAAFLVWFLAFGSGPNLTPAIVVTNFVWQALNSLVLTLGLSYGILKTQLFDIDLKLKWTLRRGTVVAIFVAVFFIAVQVVKGFLGQSLGWLFGSIATAVLVLALRPIERTAERLSDRAMPKVQRTPAYAAFRKMEVYKAAVEELSVGGVSAKERRALDALRGKLGISSIDALALEKDISTTRGVA